MPKEDAGTVGIDSREDIRKASIYLVYDFNPLLENSGNKPKIEMLLYTVGFTYLEY